ncbi:hypothetical protein [Lacisediminihabitans sp.]|uniref:hypothetical protein n=1 Tax=Lacisediminihabitans sp. TaxID=2787631 RepID=UPI002F95762E
MAQTAALPQLVSLVDLAAARILAGGSIHYFGAGTSGRLGVLAAAELLAPFTLDDGVVAAHIAGGPPALLRAVEDSEDSDADGARRGVDEAWDRRGVGGQGTAEFGVRRGEPHPPLRRWRLTPRVDLSICPDI